MKNWIMASIVFMLMATTGTLQAGINPFGFPQNKSPFARNKFPDPAGQTKQAANTQGERAPLIAGETPLEQELLMLGRELEAIADELVKALGSKEVKQEIDKKIADASKKPGPGGSARSSGGYRPGSYGGGKSYGGGSGSKPFGGRSSPSYGSKPFGGFGGGSSFGGGGGFGSFGGNRKSPSSASSFGSSGNDSASSLNSPRFSNNFKNSSSASTTPAADSTKNTVFRGSSSDKKKPDNSAEAILQTKVAKQYTEYVDTLDKEFGKIAKEANPEIRTSKLQSINLGELNKLFASVRDASSSIDAKELKAIHDNENWQKASTKLKKLQSTIAPLLIELMTPLPKAGTAKVAEASETFKQLEFDTKIAPGDLKAFAAKRSRDIKTYFTQEAAKISRRGLAEAIRNTEKKALGEQLKKIIDAFPIGLLGAPVPPDLERLAQTLNR